MNNTTTTNGQEPVYNGTRLNEAIIQSADDLLEQIQNKPKPSPKWLLPLLYIAGIALFAFFMYQVYQQGVNAGTSKAIKEQIEANNAKIKAVEGRKEVNITTELQRSKSSVERSEIIRNGVIVKAPKVKDTTRDYKVKFLKEIAHGNNRK